MLFDIDSRMLFKILRPGLVLKFFQGSLSHQIFGRICVVLNIDENKNVMYSFTVICETNLLSLVSLWLDNNYQIQLKMLQ